MFDIEIPKSVKEILTNTNTDSRTKSAELNWNPDLDNTSRGTGSSRHYWEMPTEKNIILDGKKTKIKHGIKLAVKSELDDYHDKEMFGKLQNKEEYKDVYDKHRILVKDKTGNYHTNTNGILAPIFNSHHDGSILNVGHAVPMTNNKTEFNEIIKNQTPKTFKKRKPDIDDVIYAVKDVFNKKEDADLMDDYSKHVLQHHPFAKLLHGLLSTTKMSPNDLHAKNFGTFIHPITHEKYPVVLDYGATNETMDLYTRAEKNKESGEKIRTLKESWLEWKTRKEYDNNK